MLTYPSKLNFLKAALYKYQLKIREQYEKIRIIQQQGNYYYASKKIHTGSYIPKIHTTTCHSDFPAILIQCISMLYENTFKKVFTFFFVSHDSSIITCDNKWRLMTLHSLRFRIYIDGHAIHKSRLLPELHDTFIKKVHATGCMSSNNHCYPAISRSGEFAKRIAVGCKSCNREGLRDHNINNSNDIKNENNCYY